MSDSTRVLRLRNALVPSVALLATACTASSAPAIPLPAGEPTVVVSMDEYRFRFDPDIPGGRVVFRFDNVGQLPHRVTMVPLDEDVPPVDQQLQGSERIFVSPFAGIPNRPPGASGTFAVDLVPGVRYALICFVEDEDGQTHASKGMASEFRAFDADTVAGSSSTTSSGG